MSHGARQLARARAPRALTPPRPLLERDLLAVASRLDFRPAGGSGSVYGTFAPEDDLTIGLSLVDGPEPGQTRWTALELPTTPRPLTYAAIRDHKGPPGLGSVLFDREVWAALRGGTLDAGGALVHDGGRHHLAWWFDGRFFTARLVPADEQP